MFHTYCHHDSYFLFSCPSDYPISRFNLYKFYSLNIFLSSHHYLSLSLSPDALLFLSFLFALLFTLLLSVSICLLVPPCLFAHASFQSSLSSFLSLSASWYLHVCFSALFLVLYTPELMSLWCAEICGGYVRIYMNYTKQPNQFYVIAFGM